MADRREQLVEALERVVARAGWEGATVAAIAAEAGLAPGLVHYYFPRKLDLLLALIARLQATLEERVRRRRGDPLEALIDACLALDEDTDPDAVRCFVAIGAQAAREPEVAVAWRSALDALRDQLREVLGDDAAAAGLLAAILGCWQLGALDRMPAGSAAATVRRMARGLR